MKMLLDVTFPNEPFNTLVRKGTAGKKIADVMEAIKPEAAYFSEKDGKRGVTMIVEVAEPSKIPGIAEPLFLTFEADVKLRIVMGPEELQKAGLDAIGKKWA
ncbi:MAG TPA: panthothenate synthetase [Verrucomicrobiae bacterium]|nr:panthothenate synthetase [Verrucomicrobiae bacterium]